MMTTKYAITAYSPKLILVKTLNTQLGIAQSLDGYQKIDHNWAKQAPWMVFFAAIGLKKCLNRPYLKTRFPLSEFYRIWHEDLLWLRESQCKNGIDSDKLRPECSEDYFRPYRLDSKCSILYFCFDLVT